MATVVATDLWYEDNYTDFHVHFGDNGGVRFSFIRAGGAGAAAQNLMSYYLKLETKKCSRTWFARVPTEANLSDFPSRRQQHHLILQGLDASAGAKEKLETILQKIKKTGLQPLEKGETRDCKHSEKRRAHQLSCR